MEFPVLVYKGEGKYQRLGGGYDFLGAKDEAELQEALSNGWFLTLPEAIDAFKAKQFAPTPVSKPSAPVSEPVPDDSAPPTREELEIKATELGIKFDGRYSDKKIAQMIDEALAQQ
jgi:hypothetical protein